MAPAVSDSDLSLMRKTASPIQSQFYWTCQKMGSALRLCLVFNRRICAFPVTLTPVPFLTWLPPPTDHAEFARCPQPLPMGSPSLPISSCELNKNTRRCHQQPLATHLSCRLYQTCDHAVLISGTVCVFTYLFHPKSPNDCLCDI